ncbi:MAG: hypothetical protein Q7T55_25215 [Solirubrobacteraceae bacterium]|nr:hypothetical protein [Solirubrobacteraceae bacterium]
MAARPAPVDDAAPPTWARDRRRPGYGLIAAPTERDPIIAAHHRSFGRKFLANLREPTSIGFFAVSGGLAFFDPAVTGLFWFIGLGTILMHTDFSTDGGWWGEMLEVLGLRPLSNDEVPPMTPLLRLAGGNSLVFGPLLGGEDDRRQLLMFSSRPTSQQANAVRQAGDNTFTAVLYRAPVTLGFPFLGAAPAISKTERLTNLALASLTSATLRDVTHFSVESVALHERFDLRCTTGFEGDARRIFSPTFMVWFAEQGIHFECEHGYLVVYVPHHLAHRDQFRDLLTRADRIYAELGGR